MNNPGLKSLLLSCPVLRRVVIADCADITLPAFNKLFNIRGTFPPFLIVESITLEVRTASALRKEKDVAKSSLKVPQWE